MPSYNGVEMTTDQFNAKLKEDHDKYWPAFLSADLLSGSMEVGRDLYMNGSFGGFGGSLGLCYDELDKAVEATGPGKQIYRIKVEYVGYIDNDHKLVENE
jgi:hypothetical protein